MSNGKEDLNVCPYCESENLKKKYNVLAIILGLFLLISFSWVLGTIGAIIMVYFSSSPEVSCQDCNESWKTGQGSEKTIQE